MEKSSPADKVVLPTTDSQTSSQTLPPRKRNWLVIIVVLQFFILIALGSILAYTTISELPREPKKDDVVAIKEAMPLEEIKNLSEIKTIFLRDNDLWGLMSDGTQQQITQTEGNVGNYAFSSDYSKIAYFQTKRTVNLSGSEFIEPIKVLYLDLTNNQHKEVFSLEPKTIDNSEYIMMLRDIAFLPDDMGFVFSTSDTIYQYTIDSQQLGEIFTAPVVDPKAKDVVYGYYDMEFSPDQQKILLKKAFYEWMEWWLLDINSGAITKLPMNGSGYGTMVEVNWKDNNELIVFENIDFEPNSSSRYYSIDPTGKISQNEKDLHGYFPESATYSMDGKYVYGINGKRVITQTFPDGSQSSDYYFQVIRIDLKTGEVLEIYSTKVVSEHFSGLRLSADNSFIYFVLNKYSSSNLVDNSSIYQIDLTTPNAQPVLTIPKGAFEYQY